MIGGGDYEDEFDEEDVGSIDEEDDIWDTFWAKLENGDEITGEIKWNPFGGGNEPAGT